jgi:hypothetical protein
MSTIPNSAALPRSGVSRRQWIWWSLGALSLLLLVGMIWFSMMMRAMADENNPPADLDTSRTRQSAQGLYRGTYTPTLDPITIDKLHSWTLHLETADGKPVETATITVHGDMPGHGHGLPTKPIVSQHRGNGDYLVEGMKFQMPGWWYVTFDIADGGKTDTVRFDFVLK